MEHFTFDLSQPYLASVILDEGADRLKVTLHLVVDGQKTDLLAQEFGLTLTNGNSHRTTTGGTVRR